MRPTIDIICDVADGNPVKMEECKMALLTMCRISCRAERSLKRLATTVIEGKPSKFLALNAIDLLNMLFNARKKDPLEWLGPENTPGTPEHAAQQKWARDIFRKATGLDINDPRSFEEQVK